MLNAPMIESEPPAGEPRRTRLQLLYPATARQLAGAHVGAIGEVPHPVGGVCANAIPHCLRQRPH